MKKVMAFALGATLVFATAGQASAAAMETSGEYRARFWYLDNYSQNAANQESQDFWDQRLRVKSSWKISDAVTLNARADILEFTWDTVTNEAASDKEIDFDWAYADIALSGSTRMQAGKMDVSWGPGVYAKADARYRFRLASKIGEIPIAFAYDKMNEQHLDDVAEHTEDWNGYSLGAVVPLGSWKLGVLGVYSDNDPADANLMGLDVTADGMLGPAKFVFEGAYGAGEVGDNDQDGLMAYVGATMPIGPIGLGLEFGYAAGNDPKTADNEGALFHDYNGPFNSFILFNNFDLDGWNSVYSGGADKGLNNAMAFKASATFAASPKLSFMGAVVYAQADQTVANQDSDMGVEVDALAKYALTENVTLQAGFGYLAAGGFYGDLVDDPWVGTAHAVVTF